MKVLSKVEIDFLERHPQYKDLASVQIDFMTGDTSMIMKDHPYRLVQEAIKIERLAV